VVVAVAVVDVAVAVVVDAVAADLARVRPDVQLEVRVVELDARVEDLDDDVRRARRDVPGLEEADGLVVVLGSEARVVGRPGRGDGVLGLDPADAVVVLAVDVGLELGVGRDGLGRRVVLRAAAVERVVEVEVEGLVGRLELARGAEDAGRLRAAADLVGDLGRDGVGLGLDAHVRGVELEEDAGREQALVRVGRHLDHVQVHLGARGAERERDEDFVHRSEELRARSGTNGERGGDADAVSLALGRVIAL